MQRRGADGKALRQAGDDPVRDRGKLLPFAPGAPDDREFVTADPPDPAPFADLLLQPLADLDQKLIANGMAKCVVN